MAMSRMDRFLVSKEWEGSFAAAIQTALPRGVSYHRHIKLSSNEVGWGPRPFRFENGWLLHKDFLSFLKGWLEQSDVQGFAGFK